MYPEAIWKNFAKPKVKMMVKTLKLSLQRSEFSEGELAEDSDETDSLQVKKSRKETTHQEKLKEIDDQMQVKIKELHKIISEGGLTKSTRLMDQCSESQR